MFVESKAHINAFLHNAKDDNPAQSFARFIVPYKGPKPSLFLRQRLNEIFMRIGVIVQPVFTSSKLTQILSPREQKPDLVNKQCVVYRFTCDRCDADYVGMTAQHLHQRVESHKRGESSIARHCVSAHGVSMKDLGPVPWTAKMIYGFLGFH